MSLPTVELMSAFHPFPDMGRVSAFDPFQTLALRYFHRISRRRVATNGRCPPVVRSVYWRRGTAWVSRGWARQGAELMESNPDRAAKAAGTAPAPGNKGRQADTPAQIPAL